MSDLREQFQSGTADFRPIPFWFWNNDLSEESLLASLEECYAKGIREVLIHPRTGMTVDYLSDIFWDRVSFAVKAAAARGMKVWLYDEFNWPSGAVGGQLLATYPQYVMRVLNVEERVTIPQQEVVIAFPGQFLAAFEIDEQTGTYRSLAGSITATEMLRDNDFLEAAEAFFPGKNAADIATFGDQPEALYQRQFVATPSTGRVMIFSIETNRTGWAHTTHQETPLMAGFIDKLNPEAVQQFIGMTHDAYYERLSDYFGTTIVGIFTDEPAAWSPPNHFDFFATSRQSSLVWSEHLLEHFQECYEYDLLQHLPELVRDLPGSQSTRYAFWQLANIMYREAYFRQIARWCQQKGIAFTGHINYEESPGTLIRNETGIFNNLRDMQIPGCDYLTRLPGFSQHDMNFSAKLVTSIAHAMGRDRVMCEIFGASGWRTSLADCRRTLNWAMATGISILSTHGHYLSIQGMRKRDYPPSHSKHEPWWAYYSDFSDYANRVGLLTSYGAYQGDIAILYSFGNQWMRYSLEQWTSDTYWSEHQRFVALMMAFLQNQHDFDFVFDEQFQEGLLEIRDGELIAPGATYRLLVIPPVEQLPLQVAEGVLNYARSGGRVLLIGAWPLASEERGNDARLLALGTELAVFPETQVIHVPVPHTGDWSHVVEQVVHTVELIHELPITILSDRRKDYIMMHRRGQDYELIFISNLGEHTAQATLQIWQEGDWEIWNPEGSQQCLPHVSHQMLPYTLDVTLHTGEARCLIRPLNIQVGVGVPASSYIVKDKSYQGMQVVADLTYGWLVRPLKGNMYAPDKWEARLVEGPETWMPFSPTHDFYANPHLNRKLMIRNALCQFRTSFSWEGITIPADLRIVLERERDLRVWLNEQELDSPEEVWLWDDSNIAYGIADKVRVDVNHLCIEQRWPDYLGGFHPPYATLEPVVLNGTFRVIDGVLRDFTPEISCGSWHTQGFPHYIGSMEYRYSFSLDQFKEGNGYHLIFEAVQETAEIWVNGAYAGVRVWEPYEFDVSKLVQAGKNELRVVVSNTAANLLQPDEAQPCGLLGKVVLLNIH